MDYYKGRLIYQNNLEKIMEKKIQQQQDNFDGGDEIKGNWFTFDKVGDCIKGTYVGISQKPATGKYPSQMVYEVKREDGVVWNVPISITKTRQRIIDGMKQIKFGQIVAFKFMEEIESKTKGFQPCKNIVAKSYGMDINYEAGEGIVASDPESTAKPTDPPVPFN